MKDQNVGCLGDIKSYPKLLGRSMEVKPEISGDPGNVVVN